MFVHGLFHALRPRHPLVRLLAGLVGAAALLLLIALGVFAMAAIAVGGLVFMLVNALRSPDRPVAAATAPPRAPQPGVIDGEFTVVSAAGRTREASR